MTAVSQTQWSLNQSQNSAKVDRDHL